MKMKEILILVDQVVVLWMEKIIVVYILQMSGELGELNFRVEYVSMMQINQSYDVDCYFRMHRGCHVTLYQDVKVPDNLPYFNMVRGPHDAPLQTHSCWRDLYDRCVSALRSVLC